MNQPIIWSYWNHEPIYHLKRMGNDGGTVFSLGEWLDEWYDRIHGEELIKKGAELGINMVYTHYYKGSGIQFEYEEMERTKEFTEIAHKYGIKVLGYVSMGSIYTENITREIPDVKDMLQVDRNGKFIPTLTNQYYRPRPCYNSDQYLAHLKSIIKYGIEHVGLDGFHFDNSDTNYCYCKNCQEKFRNFLRENFKNPYEVMGIKDFDYVEIPQYDFSDDFADVHMIAPRKNIHDTLFVWYHRFVQKTVADFHTACFDYVKEVSGGKALVLHNPGFPRAYHRRIKGFEPMDSPKSCDFAFVETSGGYFGKKAGRVTGQTTAFKFGERFGYKVFDTSWAKGEKVVHRFPEDREEILGFIMQAAIYGSIAGVPWTVRSMKNGDEVAIDTEYLFDGLKESFAYFKDHFTLFDAQSYNHVKLLYHPDSCFCTDKGFDHFLNTAEMLTKNRIPYSIITEDEILSLETGDTIILPKILYCGKECFDKLAAVHIKGVKMIATEGFGHYNENTKGRSEKSEIYDLKGLQGAIMVAEEELCNYIPRGLQISEEDILLETRVTQDGNLVLHVLNADHHRALSCVEVTFEDPALLSCTHCEVYTPDDTKAEVCIRDGKLKMKIYDYKTLVSVVCK